MKTNSLDIVSVCDGDPSYIFTLIKQEEYKLVGELIVGNVVNINYKDNLGNDIMTRLLKAKEYDLLLILMKKKNWDVNNQNEEGNTFGHILAADNSIKAVEVFKELVKKSNYQPNIKNNNGDTALDIAISNQYLCTAFKILEDKRFTDIDVFSFKNLFDISINNDDYGKYSKLTNLDILVNSLEKKELLPRMRELIDIICANLEAIKRNILNNRIDLISLFIDNSVKEVILEG